MIIVATGGWPRVWKVEDLADIILEEVVENETFNAVHDFFNDGITTETLIELVTEDHDEAS